MGSVRLEGKEWELLSRCSLTPGKQGSASAGEMLGRAVDAQRETLPVPSVHTNTTALPFTHRLTLQTRNKLQPPKAVTLLQLSTAQAIWNTRQVTAGDQTQMTFCCRTSSTLPFADIPESFLICLLHLCFLLSVQCCWLFSRKLSWLQSRFYMQQKAGFFLPLSTPHPFQPLSSLIQPFLGRKGQAIILTPEASFKSFSTSCTLMRPLEIRFPPSLIQPLLTFTLECSKQIHQHIHKGSIWCSSAILQRFQKIL